MTHRFWCAHFANPSLQQEDTSPDMRTSITELVARREDLERQIRALRQATRAEALSAIRRLMVDHGLTTVDLDDGATFQRAAAAQAGVKRVAPKYRDPVSGKTWSGRGLKPRWLAAALVDGKALENFAV